jgi:hypothetical protein
LAIPTPPWPPTKFTFVADTAPVKVDAPTAPPAPPVVAAVADVPPSPPVSARVAIPVVPVTVAEVMAFPAVVALAAPPTMFTIPVVEDPRVVEMLIMDAAFVAAMVNVELAGIATAVK